MKKVLLMGNPNVGKSAFFSRLTGVHVITSNYPGTTVEFTKGYMLFAGEKAEVIDVPGTYTLEPTCKAEEVACEMLKLATKEVVQEGDVIINVVDATNLERNLYLTLELMEQKIPIIVALNMWDDTKHKGIHIDVEKLAEWLGVPVVPTVAVTGEGFAKLIGEIYKARAPWVRKHTLEERWKDVGKVVTRVQRLEHRHHTLLERFQDLTIKPLTGLPIAAAIAYLAFKVIRFIGEGLIGYVFEPLFNNFYTPLIMKLSALLGSTGFWHDILVGKLINGQIDYLQSMGVLTTGFFIPIGAVLPYVLSFYFVLGLLEDSGYLPRLAVLMDNLMHRIGLHGFAIVPTLLSFGCNVPGILATRILESKRERFIASTLISVGVPCAALQAMIIGVLGYYGARPVAIVYGTLFLVWLTLGYVLNKLLPGFSPELLLEIPPYRFPPLTIIYKKLWWRMKAFLKEAVPIVLIGVFVVNILYVLGVFNFIADISAPIVTGLLGLPKEAVTAIVIGFLRKDVAVGMLVPLGLSVSQLIVACVVLSMFFPCVATFVVLIQELGWKDMLKATAIMIVAALLAGSLLNFIL
ncbi:MAG: ferrous iron transporter B [Candidatus Margulisbacteria bacterium]|nr:ferrous iron transporter B [Candidatus Margulisiibacteriota bacterium]MBU1022376.1 ferrous iron transporter B [Candidatus Margulisiibacteriota bacterium]MBU1729072.1 ferrous iron transporter B [Candidatus Margulisiibacteriota bacterium]MBU1954507.1 ferrous iron transporter B [Candidatus Margulisiibacteriota bacterium]